MKDFSTFVLQPDFFLHETIIAHRALPRFFLVDNWWRAVSLLRTLMSTRFEEKAATACLDAYLIVASVLPPTGRMFSVSVVWLVDEIRARDKVGDTNPGGYQPLISQEKLGPVSSDRHIYRCSTSTHKNLHERWYSSHNEIFTRQLRDSGDINDDEINLAAIMRMLNCMVTINSV